MNCPPRKARAFPRLQIYRATQLSCRRRLQRLGGDSNRADSIRRMGPERAVPNVVFRIHDPNSMTESHRSETHAVIGAALHPCGVVAPEDEGPMGPTSPRKK